VEILSISIPFFPISLSYYGKSFFGFKETGTFVEGD
jgi:hypothetical protein